MLFTINELFDLIIMTFAIGYLFSTMIKKAPEGDYDPLTYFSRKNTFFEDLKYGIIVAAPAIVLHELMHKFTAIAFGAIAILKAPLDWYIVALVLRFINFPIFFFVGGYVVHSPLPPLESALVSVSGPILNLALFLICKAVVHFKLAKRKHYDFIGIVSKLNLFLFIFNMLPIPSFDGFNFYRALVMYFFKI